jgi:hypothetical protein
MPSLPESHPMTTQAMIADLFPEIKVGDYAILERHQRPDKPSSPMLVRITKVTPKRVYALANRYERETGRNADFATSNYLRLGTPEEIAAIQERDKAEAEARAKVLAEHEARDALPEYRIAHALGYDTKEAVKIIRQLSPSALAELAAACGLPENKSEQ